MDMESMRLNRASTMRSRLAATFTRAIAPRMLPIAVPIATAFILTASAAWSQTAAPNPTQQPQSVTPRSNEPVNIGGQVPLFRIEVVGRTTPAINYRPRKGDTKIDFAGTPLLPMARGNAEVSGEKGYIKIDARFDKLQPASRFGREYLTYVLWAITPEGRATNLGEVQVDDEDARVQVTTELQAFGLVVTAEPYFAVTQPSDVVVLENVVREGRDGTEGKVETIQARYELLKRGAYLMNQDAAQLKTKALEPGAPLDLAQARNAVELARVAGAERHASETYQKAATLLATAELAREKRRNSNAIMMPARQAAQTAEDARLVALQRQEEEFQADQRRQAQAREQAVIAREEEARARAEAEAARRRQAEVDAQSAAAARAEAERNARLAEQNAQAALSQQAEALRAKADADAARAAADAARRDAEASRAQAEAARAQADSARQQAEAEASRAHSLAMKSEQEKEALRANLREQLNVILETRETARGLVVNVSDVLFDTGKANLKPGAREKLARVSGILAAHPGLRLEIEGHTDSVGTDDYNQNLSERRAQTVREYLVSQRIAADSVIARGFGETQPVASNDNAAGRQQNRRVELVVSGESIGTR
jgi:outer membrane protein OmpA-like peptidoglycan-associated protein